MFLTQYDFLKLLTFFRSVLRNATTKLLIIKVCVCVCVCVSVREYCEIQNKTYFIDTPNLRSKLEAEWDKGY